MGEQATPDLDALYATAVDLGDRARGWYDGPGVAWRAGLPAGARAAVAVESLGTTARLLGVMAWLLDPAHDAGRLPAWTIGDDGPSLPAGSPLAGTHGGLIAVAARQLAGRVAALARAATTA